MSALLSASELAGMRAGALPFKSVPDGVAYGFNNTLIEAATPSQDRMAQNLVDYDFHRVISVQGRRLLLSMARTLFWKQPALQGAILEQANLAVSTFTPRFRGRNKDWGDAATMWLADWHKIFDLAGWPYDDETYRELLLLHCIVDGEMGTLLTQDASGNPRIQIILSHRIGSRYQTSGAVKVRYEGNQLWVDDVLVDDSLPWTYAKPVEWMAPIIDGVIVDDQAKAIAYRVFDDPATSSKYQDISARNMFLSFIPMFGGQLRGISLLASSLFPWEDVTEWRKFEMLAQKTFSTRTIVEENETGDLDAAKQLVGGAVYASATKGPDGKPLPQQKLTPDLVKADAGTYTIFKARQGCKLTAFDWNRPSQDAQQFQELTVRDAFRGTEWDVYFSLDPTKVGGAPMRVVVDRINRVLKKRRRTPAKAMLRIDCYGLAKGAMRSGALPIDPEWYKWHYQGPPDITADRRYEAQTDQMEYEEGWVNLEDIEKKRNGDWRLKREQREAEVRDKLTRAKSLAAEFGITIQEAMVELGKPAAQAAKATGASEPDGDDPQPGKSKGQKEQE